MIRTLIDALHVREGDVILVKVERRITAEQARKLQEHTEQSFPGHRVVVLPPELELRSVDDAILEQVLEEVRGKR